MMARQLIVEDNSKAVKVKDNSKIESGDIAKIKSLVEQTENKTFAQFENDGVLIFPKSNKDSEDIESDQLVLEHIDDKYFTKNILGFIGYKDERLAVTSRFCEGGNDYFLRYLLLKVLGIPNVIDLPTDADYSDSSFYLPVLLFPYCLKTALRKGVFKTYIRREYNDLNPKGPIDIARHIRQNTPFVGNIAYSCREYSYDNDLMELVRHTIEFIKQRYGYSLLSRVREEVNLVASVTPAYRMFDRQKIVAKNEKNILTHAYYYEYRALQHLCILILQRQKIGYGARKMYGILFDGAWLWEEYVNTLIGKYFYHPMNKAGIDAQQLFSGERQTGLIYPDFIGRGANSRIIADAKYKKLDNISGRDYLQLLAYMFRFDSKTGYYLYPKNSDEKIALKVLNLNSGTTYENNVKAREDIRIIKLGLQIPCGASSYSDFEQKMKISEKEFCSKF